MVSLFALLTILTYYVVTFCGAEDDRDNLLAFTQDWNCTDSTWNKSNSCQDWNGVECKGDLITSFIWKDKSCTSTSPLNMTLLPRSLSVLSVIDNLFTGTIDLTTFPPTMTEIWLANNSFSGTLNFSSLASRLPLLQHIEINVNKFSGTVDLSAFPERLVHFIVSHNRFSGSVDLTSALPKSLRYFYLNVNDFTGSVHLASLPPLLTDLFLEKNRFSGSLNLISLPRNLYRLALQDNQFSGSVVLPHGIPKIALNLSSNNFTGTLNFSALSPTIEDVLFHRNSFFGTVPWSSLPSTLWFLILDHNQFSGPVHLSQIPIVITPTKWMKVELNDNAFSCVDGNLNLTDPTNRSIAVVNDMCNTFTTKCPPCS
eukprot:PhF_6_TR8292/c0_g2_i7/m.12753